MRLAAQGKVQQQIRQRKQAKAAVRRKIGLACKWLMRNYGLSSTDHKEFPARYKEMLEFTKKKRRDKAIENKRYY